MPIPENHPFPFGIREKARQGSPGFTALESLVMLAILFVLTILLIGLAVKETKEDDSLPLEQSSNVNGASQPAENQSPGKRPK